jgi:L-ascorbate metabolism protein UlaG (beta-lactamase superfamily)
MGKDFFVSEGSIALTLLNVYSSIVLKTHLAAFVFDPVKLNLDSPPFDDSVIDAIVITHEHADHFDKGLVLEMQGRSGAQILTTPFVARKLGVKTENLGAGESVKIKDMTFYAERCVHPANQPLAFVMKTEGVTIYHPSDSEAFPEMEEVKNKYKPDILLYLGTTKKGLVDITELVRPKIVVSYFAPRFADLKVPGVQLKMVKQFETFIYPEAPGFTN